MTDVFTPTRWSEAEILDRFRAAGVALPAPCLPGVKANLALLEDRWRVVQAALAEIEP
ncbi:MAG: hypothetical protein KGJ57_01875 [Sphingomonadales bacterium]|nr:hypothetical protein [Sphingomonadales bacterium]MDE2168158.1 hypothetical protein [Sphingomonadales bacterium]